MSEQLQLFRDKLVVKDMTTPEWRDIRSSKKDLALINESSIIDIYINGTLTTALVLNLRPNNCFDIIITSGNHKKKKLTISVDNVYACYNGFRRRMDRMKKRIDKIRNP